MLALGVTGAGMLGGCAAPATGNAEVYTEPGWMAQARQQVEEYQSSMVACLAESGVEGIVSIGGPVGTGGVTDDEGNLPAGVQELQESAATECTERVPLPSAWTLPPDDAAYERMLDVRRCLSSHGYDLPDPPSAEVWKEQAESGTAWNPYEILLDPTSPLVSDDELRTLMEACPQSGHGLQTFLGDDAFD